MKYGQEMERSSKIIAGDRRLTLHLMGLWQSLRRGENSCVSAEEFNAALTEELWADCCIIEIAEGGDRLVSRIGATIAKRSSVKSVPMRVADLPPRSVLAASVLGLDDALRSGAPILEDGEIEDEFGRPALFRSILLPLADQEGTFVQCLAGARFRTRREDA